MTAQALAFKALQEKYGELRSEQIERLRANGPTVPDGTSLAQYEKDWFDELVQRMESVFGDGRRRLAQELFDLGREIGERAAEEKAPDWRDYYDRIPIDG